MRAIDGVSINEALDGHAAYIGVDRATEQVVENTEPQGAADRIDALDLELVHGRDHDCEPAGEHRRALELEGPQRHARDMTRSDHALAQAGKSCRRDATAGETVLFQDFRERCGGSRRSVCLTPMRRAEFARNRFDLDPGRGFCCSEGFFTQSAVRKIALRQPDTADLERLRRSGSSPRPMMSSVEP